MIDIKTNIEQSKDISLRYLPTDRIFGAKNNTNSNLNKLIDVFSREQKLFFQTLHSLIEGFRNHDSILFIDLFEELVGIPDGIFINDVDLETRWRQVEAKLKYMRLAKVKDWYKLARHFFYEIEIKYPEIKHTFLPAEFPILLVNNPEDASFIITIVLISYKGKPIKKPDNQFPLKLPFEFQSSTHTQIQKIFRLLKPVNVRLKFEYAIKN